MSTEKTKKKALLLKALGLLNYRPTSLFKKNLYKNKIISCLYFILLKSKSQYPVCRPEVFLSQSRTKPSLELFFAMTLSIYSREISSGISSPRNRSSLTASRIRPITGPFL